MQKNGIERLIVDPECSVRTTYEPIELASGDDVFTDAKLKAALTEQSEVYVASLIYIWSPHMPLSVDGYEEIAQATSDLNVGLIPVLFAGSERAFAEREASRVGMPRDGLQELASNELIFRDAHVHAPTIVIFTDNATSAVLPGYRNAAGYRRFIDNFLLEQRRAGSVH